jgi:GNAT superfamily N-acetyltransferase
MSKLPELSIDLLTRSHDRSQFDCGIESLNRYLKTQATQDVRRHLAHVYVMAGGDGAIVGYYSLSAGHIEHEHLPLSERKKLPRYPIPAALIGRLAIDRRFQGQGLARILLGDALRRALTLSESLGIHAIVVDAKDEAAASFYGKFGFLPLTDSSLHLYLPVKTVKDAT